MKPDRSIPWRISGSEALREAGDEGLISVAVNPKEPSVRRGVALARHLHYVYS